jgi:enamine deaminase RidA (YjgF/YER057c/UK114 family)
MCFLSGVTTERGSLDEQVAEILPRIRDSLKHAGIPWAQVVRVAAFLHRSQRLDHLERLLRHHELPSSMQLVFGIADGYSTPGKLVEIEVTALA